MLYTSTRDKNVKITAAEAISRGISTDGGLLVPQEIPKITPDDIERLRGMDYRGRAAEIMGLYLDEFSADELAEFCAAAYSAEKFGGEAAPVKKTGEGYFLELWHGPTCAFKDMALQMLPHLLTASLKKSGQSEKALILVATSGDTGKAALEGFRDVEGTKIMVFYPSAGVSDIQKLQMTSQEGGNVSVYGVNGNFDDAQTGVKKIFADRNMADRLAAVGYKFSSANSINWGRLLPQIVYYISAYCDMLNMGEIKAGDQLNFCVPTGNFGNILAAYYAKEMGLPVGRLICASNRNNILTDFINTGVYDRRREFFTTISPSMDILISSNLERLLYLLGGRDADMVARLMHSLSEDGIYSVDGELKEKLGSLMYAGYCDDAETKRTIRAVRDKSGYLIDTHTAVAEAVKDRFYSETGDKNKTVVVSTANPYKFCDSVLDALGIELAADGVALIDVLEKETGVAPPRQIAALRGAKPRFTEVTEKEGMAAAVLNFAN